MKKLLFLLLLSPNISFADGNSLLAHCLKAGAAIQPDGEVQFLQKDGYSVGYCMGKLHSFKQQYDYMAFNNIVIQNNAMRSCPLPEDLQESEMVGILVKFLQDNSNQLGVWEASLIESAFDIAYPCP